MSWLDGGVGGSSGGGVFGGDGEWGIRDDSLWGEVHPGPRLNVTLEERCEAAFKYDYHVVVAVSCLMLLLFGIVYSLFGYRCFKAVMFLTGFLFGSVVVYLVCLSEALLPVLGNAGVSLAAGLMFGLITMLVQYVGLFMTGFHTGLFLGVAGIAAAYPWWVPGSVWVVVGVLLGAGLLLAILTLYFQKGLTILGTAISGGALMAATLDYFIEKFVMVQWLVERLVVSSESESVCWFSWLILAVWPFMVVVGTLTQCCLTGTGIYHTQLVPNKNARNVNLQRLRSREARAEIRQKKYRYLYQVRTAHGDIISQEYIQSLQRKAYPAANDNGTLQSDSTHTTMLPPDHTPLAPLTESEDEGGGTSCSRSGASGIAYHAGPALASQAPSEQTSINIHQPQQHHPQARPLQQQQYHLQYPHRGNPHPASRPVSQGSPRCYSREAYERGGASSCGGGAYNERGGVPYRDRHQSGESSRSHQAQGGHQNNNVTNGPSEYCPSSPSPDDQYSELQYTPSPHSSSPGNYRRTDYCHNRPGSQNTPPPSPVSPLPPSPPRPYCVPR